MSGAPGPVFLDACTLWNFAVVDRLDILFGLFEAACVTETVVMELRRGARDEPALARALATRWLARPVEVCASPTEIAEIELVRRAMGGSPGRPLRHLGEAELIWLLENREIGATLATDDRPAAAFARRRGLAVIDSVDILGAAFRRGVAACPEAYEVLVAMRADHGRGVLVPDDHSAVC